VLSHALPLTAARRPGRGAAVAPSPVRSLAQGLAGAVVGAVAARAAYAVLTLPERARALAGPETRGTAGAAHGAPRAGTSAGGPGADAPAAWRRRNFRGRVVTLQEGPALAVGVCAASFLVPGQPPRVRAASALAAAGAAAFGAYDDLSGNGQARGLHGHLAALARGEVTTGLVKMVGIGATGIAAASLLRRGPADTLVDGALIAAGANLVNLFDLRPGRAAKFALLVSAPALASPAAPLFGPVVGACSALLPDDLAERSMLGDAGANALGAALGAAAVAQAPRPVRLALFGAVAALTLASEVTSFSGVIDRVPALRRLDRWGRCA